jgi:hypothetical protein
MNAPTFNGYVTCLKIESQEYYFLFLHDDIQYQSFYIRKKYPGNIQVMLEYVTTRQQGGKPVQYLFIFQ